MGSEIICCVMNLVNNILGSSHTNSLLNICIRMNIFVLQENPFSDQIVKVFSSSGDHMTFEEFLDMIAHFSHKVHFAQQILSLVLCFYCCCASIVVVDASETKSANCISYLR